MLKETENEETGFFVIGGISIEGALAPWATSLTTRIILRFAPLSFLIKNI